MVLFRHHFKIVINSVFIVIFLLPVILCSGADGLTLKSADITFSTAGEQVPVDIIADNLMTGISRYNISVIIDSPDTATISRLFFPVWAENRLRTELPATDVWMSAEDVSNTVGKGTSRTRLGMIMLSSLEQGTTGIILQVNSLTDDDTIEMAQSGATDPILSLVQNRTITLAKPSETQSLRVTLTTPPVKRTQTSQPRITPFASMNRSNVTPSLAQTFLPITSFFYEQTSTTPEYTKYVPTTYAGGMNTVTSPFSMVQSPTIQSRLIIEEGISPALVIAAILFLIAFALLLRR